MLLKELNNRIPESIRYDIPWKSLTSNLENMILYFYQIEQLLEIIDKNQRAIGADWVLTDEDKYILRKHGVDLRYLCKDNESIFNSFNLAMLADSLKAVDDFNFTYEDIEHYIKRGGYIPVSNKDKEQIKSIENQRLNELLPFGEHFELIKKEIVEGMKNKKTPTQIASNIGHKTGIWDLDGIISHYMDIASVEARVADIRKRNPNKDPLVYKSSPGKRACYDECNKMYLQNGLGSEPILFRLSILEANGSNENRNRYDWKPVVMPTHKCCYFDLYEFSPGYLWNTETQSFSTSDPEYRMKTYPNRPLIRIVVAGKEMWV